MNYIFASLSGMKHVKSKTTIQDEIKFLNDLKMKHMFKNHRLEEAINSNGHYNSAFALTLPFIVPRHKANRVNLK